MHAVGVACARLGAGVQVGAHDELTGGEEACRARAQGGFGGWSVDGRVDVDDDLTDVVGRDRLARGDAGRDGVDAVSSPQEAAEEAESDHGRDDEDDAEEESPVH